MKKYVFELKNDDSGSLKIASVDDYGFSVGFNSEPEAMELARKLKESRPNSEFFILVVAT